MTYNYIGRLVMNANHLTQGSKAIIVDDLEYAVVMIFIEKFVTKEGFAKVVLRNFTSGDQVVVDGDTKVKQLLF